MLFICVLHQVFHNKIGFELLMFTLTPFRFKIFIYYLLLIPCLLLLFCLLRH